MPLRSCASAQDQPNTYSPYEWDFTKRGMAPTIAPARRNTRIRGSHPVRALAHPVSISADRNSWRMNGCSPARAFHRSEEHTSELQSRLHLVCRLLLEKKKK